MDQERSNNGNKSPTIKEQKFAQEIVKTGNKTEAYKKVYDAKNMKLATIHHEASLTASKPQVEREIDKIMRRIDFDDAFVLAEHRKVVAQDKHLSSKVQATKLYYDIKGYTSTTAQGGSDVKIAFIIQNKG